MIHIPVQLRTRAQLDHFFTTEAFRTFVPAIFQAHADPLARFLTYLFVDDPADRMELFEQFPKAMKHIVRQLPTKESMQFKIRPIIALLRLWARYEDRSLDTDAFHCFFAQVMTELARTPARNLMELAAAVSEALFQEHADPRDLVRMTCFIVLSDNQVLIKEFRDQEVFLSPGDVPRFCHAMLTLRICQLYPTKPQIIEQFIGRKLGCLLQRAFEQLQTWILRVKRGRTQLTLLNQSDLDLNDVVLRDPISDSKEVLVTIPHLGPDSMLEVVLESEVGSEQLMAEFTDNFGTNYRILV